MHVGEQSLPIIRKRLVALSRQKSDEPVSLANCGKKPTHDEKEQPRNNYCTNSESGKASEKDAGQ